MAPSKTFRYPPRSTASIIRAKRITKGIRTTEATRPPRKRAAITFINKIVDNCAPFRRGGFPGGRLLRRHTPSLQLSIISVSPSDQWQMPVLEVLGAVVIESIGCRSREGLLIVGLFAGMCSNVTLAQSIPGWQGCTSSSYTVIGLILEAEFEQGDMNDRHA